MNQFFALLFPYRTHLEAEIEYLREQNAQKQRRIDELQTALIETAKPAVKVVYRQESNGKLVPVQPKGWDEVRAFRKANQEEDDAVQSK